MMKMLPLLALVAMLGACREDAPDATWLDTWQAKITSEPVTNPPARIYQFRYRDQIVYYRPPYCCDMQGVLYSASGTRLCAPDGGFTGHGDGSCTDFHAQRSQCELLWSDPRGKAAGASICARAATPVSSER